MSKQQYPIGSILKGRKSINSEAIREELLINDIISPYRAIMSFVLNQLNSITQAVSMRKERIGHNIVIDLKKKEKKN